MIDLKDIYAKTDKGLDIIRYYYPQAEPGKKFAVRNERTPSASIREKDGVWKLTDFGDEGRMTSPIDIVMKEEGITFREAIFLLADRYQLDDYYISPLRNKPEIRQEDAAASAEEGLFEYELNKHFTEAELELLGPNVKEEHCKKYSFYSVKEYRKTKNRKTTTIRSTENYPIFMRTCEGFQKVYSPLNPDKAFRFFYEGKKPTNFINGLAELRKAHADFVSDNEDDDDFKKPSKRKDKLPEAIICSGERDALNAASLGYYPLWFNSESYKLSKQEFSEISRLVEKVYNVPDIDSTGRKKGAELSLDFLDVYTVELPHWLSNYRDNRGKPRKDLRDYIELRPSVFDFKQLLDVARSCKFWQNITDDKGNTRLSINTTFLLYFLKQNGFGKIINPETKESTFVKLSGYIVEETTGKQIRSFILKFLRERMIDTNILNLVLNSNRTGTALMDDLEEIDIDFKNYSMDSQYVFFANKAVCVSAEEIKEVSGANSEIKVWQDKIVSRHFRRTEPAFSLMGEDSLTFDVKINNTKSHYFRFLINASRMFWREEFEYRLGKTPEENAEYTAAHKFDIAGPRLSKEEQYEQQQHLYNKIYSIGYLLHKYKSASRARAVWAMENKLTNTEDSCGGSGKSFMFDGDYVQRKYNEPSCCKF